MEAKHYNQIGWIAAIVAFFVVNLGLLAIGFGAQVIPGLLAAVGAKLWCNYKAIGETAALIEPELKIYTLPKSVVLQELKDTIPNLHIEDRWWVLHWMNANKGELKFRVNYELQGRERMEKQQIVMSIYFQPIEDNSRTSVRIIYEPNAKTDDQKIVSNDLIRQASESIEFKLRALEAGQA